MCDVIIQQKTEDTTNTTWLTNNATLGILLFIGIERCVVRNEKKRKAKDLGKYQFVFQLVN